MKQDPILIKCIWKKVQIRIIRQGSFSVCDMNMATTNSTTEQNPKPQTTVNILLQSRSYLETDFNNINGKVYEYIATYVDGICIVANNMLKKRTLRSP